MKPFRIISLFAIAFSFSVIISSCGGKHTQSEKQENMDVSKQGPEYTSAYICPMHCDGSGSDAPGKCPVCGMDYVQNKKLNESNHEGHNHDGHDHEGHNH